MREPEQIVAALEELWQATLSLLRELDDADWERPTPCSEWNVRELVAHIDGGQGLFEGFPQPQPPADWSNPHPPGTVAAATSEMVGARSNWTTAEILDELERATRAQVTRLRGLDDNGWKAPSKGPPGIKTVYDLARNRLLDGYIHLFDLRVALSRPLGLEEEPMAFAESFAQAIDFTPWGAVKRAGLGDDSHVRVELSGPEAFTGDLVIEGGRGRWAEVPGEPEDRIIGTTAAYLFVATGRPQWTEDAGGIGAEGGTAKQFLDCYVIWAP